MAIGQFYPRNLITQVLKVPNLELFFYLNQTIASVSGGLVPNLAQLNKSVVGIFGSNGTISVRQGIKNFHAIRFNPGNFENLTFGNNFNFTDAVTCFTLMKRNAAASGSFPVQMG